MYFGGILINGIEALAMPAERRGMVRYEELASELAMYGILRGWRTVRVYFLVVYASLLELSGPQC